MAIFNPLFLSEEGIMSWDIDSRALVDFIDYVWEITRFSAGVAR